MQKTNSSVTQMSQQVTNKKRKNKNVFNKIYSTAYIIGKYLNIISSFIKILSYIPLCRGNGYGCFVAKMLYFNVKFLYKESDLINGI